MSLTQILNQEGLVSKTASRYFQEIMDDALELYLKEMTRELEGVFGTVRDERFGHHLKLQDMWVSFEYRGHTFWARPASSGGSVAIYNSRDGWEIVKKSQRAGTIPKKLDKWIAQQG